MHKSSTLDGGAETSPRHTYLNHVRIRSVSTEDIPLDHVRIVKHPGPGLGWFENRTTETRILQINKDDSFHKARLHSYLCSSESVFINTGDRLHRRAKYRMQNIVFFANSPTMWKMMGNYRPRPASKHQSLVSILIWAHEFHSLIPAISQRYILSEWWNWSWMGRDYVSAVRCNIDALTLFTLSCSFELKLPKIHCDERTFVYL